MPRDRRGRVHGEVWAAAALAALDRDPMFYGRQVPYGDGRTVVVLPGPCQGGAHSHFSDQAASKARCDVAMRFNMFHRPAL
jgi:hypothetical protein